jgi:hypothetical protein
MSDKRRAWWTLTPIGLLLLGSVALGATIDRSVVGAGWGWNYGVVGGQIYTAVGTVGQAASEASHGGVGGLYIGSGFWIPTSAAPIGTAVETPTPQRLSNELEQNVPNPFNPSTTISFSLAERKMVDLRVLDVRGRVVQVLVHEERDAGRHHLEYRPADLPSGVYFYCLRAGNFAQTRRFVLIK